MTNLQSRLLHSQSVRVCDTLTVNMWCRLLHSCSGEGKCLSEHQYCLFFHKHKILKVKNEIAPAFQQDDPIPFHSRFNTLWMLGSLITGLKEMKQHDPHACLTSLQHFTCGYISNTVNTQKTNDLHHITDKLYCSNDNLFDMLHLTYVKSWVLVGCLKCCKQCSNWSFLRM